MKIPGQFAKRLRVVFNRLRRTYGKPKDIELTDPVEQLIIGILSANTSERRVKSTMKLIRDEMIDFNELRVTPVPEVERLFHQHIEAPHEKAEAVVRTLHWVFDSFHTMDLTGLREHSHGDIRDMFEKIPDCPKHARDSMLLLSFGIPVFPIDDQILQFLIDDEALPEDVTVEEAEGLVERQLRSAEVSEFYLHVKHASEHRRRPPGKPKKEAKKTKEKRKKTKKKKTTKKRSRKR